MQPRDYQDRALTALENNICGQVIVPTGGGKTFIMIKDLMRRFAEATEPMVAVVCAPRILLAKQLSSEFLEFITDVEVMHVHSGETHHFRTTKPSEIVRHNLMCKNVGAHQLIFTTYHSLCRFVECEQKIDVAYFDEAHNATKRNFFASVSSLDASNYYYFTATPKHTRSFSGTGMNNSVVFGKIIATVPAPELVKNGSILAPTVVAHEVDIERLKGAMAASSDRQTLLDIVDGLDGASASKVLVAAPSSKTMWELLSHTNVIDELHDRGYDVLHITSKYGAWVNRAKVNRDVFFNTFNAYGKDPNRKFIIFHYSILSEGINVNGLTHCIMLRNMNVIEMAQTIGRVIRLNKEDAVDIASGKIPAGQCQFYRKSTGFVTVPVFKNYGDKTIKRLQNVVNTIFVEGKPAVSISNY